MTGAAGFIGAALCRRLSELGALVHGLARPGADTWRLQGVHQLTVHAADLRAPEVVGLVRDISPAWLFDTAAEGGHFGEADLTARRERHLAAVDSVVAGAAAAGTSRLVHLGSSLEYGSRAGLIDEATPPAPSVARGLIKLASTERCLRGARAAGVDAVVLRLFHVYGPREQPWRLIPTAIAAALDGRSISITAEDPVRDYVYLDDVVDACLRAALSPGIAYEVLNIGTGVATSNRELLSAVERAAGVRLALAPAPFPSRAADPERRIADNRRARAALSWQPRSGLAQGLAAALAWARSRPESRARA